MRKTAGVVILMGIFVFFTGCASTQDIKSLSNRVGSLESETNAANTRLRKSLRDLEDVLAKQHDVNTSLMQELQDIRNKIGEVSKTRNVGFQMPGADTIQTALQNAGFYDGEIDGKIGRETKEAVMRFQEANGLTPDGVVGSKTWAILSKFLAEKVK